MERPVENLIDQSVLFVLSAFETEKKSKIVTKHSVYYSRDSVLSLIDQACMLAASTYEGRIKANRHNLKHFKKKHIVHPGWLVRLSDPFSEPSRLCVDPQP